MVMIQIGSKKSEPCRDDFLESRFVRAPERARVERMVKAFQANIVDAYGDGQLLILE